MSQDQNQNLLEQLLVIKILNVGCKEKLPFGCKLGIKTLRNSKNLKSSKSCAHECGVGWGWGRMGLQSWLCMPLLINQTLSGIDKNVWRNKFPVYRTLLVLINPYGILLYQNLQNSYHDSLSDCPFELKLQAAI